jgi:hypothetical protein
VESGTTVTFKAGSRIIFKNGTHIKNGSNAIAFTGQVDCNDYLSNGDMKSLNNTLPPSPQTTANNQAIQTSKVNNNNNSFSVTPNPNNGNMNVEYEIPKGKIGVLEVFNSLGTKLFSYPLNEGKNTFAINGANLISGIYFYRAIAGNKIIAKDKIVVIK